MGGSGSAQRADAVDRRGLSEEQYQALRSALFVDKTAPEAEVRIELTAFLARFPQALKPLVQPLFFKLGQEKIGAEDVAWPKFVAGVADLVCGDADWFRLLETWTDEGSLGEAEIDLHLELAVSLCFWCALACTAPETGADSASSGHGAGLDPGLTVAALRIPAATGGASCPPSAGGGLNAIVRHLELVAPFLPRAVSVQLAGALLGAAQPPDLASAVLAESRILHDAGLPLLLRAIDAELWYSDDWVPLFRDWQDGRSFNAFMKGTLHYEGPALLLVRTGEGHLLGAMSSSWHDLNGEFGGGPSCFLFSCAPTMQVMRSRGASGSYLYLNSKNKFAPRGIGFGGMKELPRFWLDADFENCHVLQSDATYGAGLLLPGEEYKTPFDAAHIEVWGCGGRAAAAAQEKAQGRDAGLREQARKVDRARMCETEFDKEMFFQGKFTAGRDQDKSTGGA